MSLLAFYRRRLTQLARSHSAEPVAIAWASELAGRILAAGFAALRMVRGPRPIHPNGSVYVGQVDWVSPGARNSGIAWIDTPPPSGEQRVIVRVSRSVGLPAALPDVIGLAFTFTTERGAADVELASSWFGRPGRFLLRPTRSSTGAFGSLMPYRGDFGAVLLGARVVHRADESWRIDLLHATPTSSWSRFAVVSLGPESRPDSADLRFDPIVNPLPGADTYDWTRRLRQRSYRVARRSRAVPKHIAPTEVNPGRGPHTKR
jgi:hypothetical protein